MRAALAPEDVGMVGWAGATDVRGLAWWEGHVTCAAAIHRYEEHGGGDIPALSWIRRGTPPAEVDCLDGQLLVLSPWAVRTLRFDEGLLFGHGFDLDFSLQVRAAGRRLMVADLQVSHHRSLELVADLDVWVQAHIQIAEKWTGILDDRDLDAAAWKQRARRAEARREAARAYAVSNALILDARVLELERALAAKTGSRSWRFTAPLRALNRVRREAADRRTNGAAPATVSRRWD